MKLEVSVDTSAAAGMFDRLKQQATQTAGGAVERAGQEALGTVSGVPVDTGALASSLRVESEGTTARIVSDVPYAKYVFYGTRHMEASPPQLDYDAAQLAEHIARELFD
jgi:hypothetical protein